MKYVLFILISLPIHVFAQENISEKWNELSLEEANTGKDISYLSEEEKKVIFYTNLVRLNPFLFEKTFFKQYLATNEVKQSKATRSLSRLLKHTKPMTVLMPHSELYVIAEKHAKDLGENGRRGHYSTLDAKNFFVGYPKLFENCSYRYGDGLAIVINLLIDKDYKYQAHRKAILNRRLFYTGISIKPNTKYKVNCVQIISTEL